jgi:hypothetical protein
MKTDNDVKIAAIEGIVWVMGLVALAFCTWVANR